MPRYRRKTIPLRLRDETRTALVMLAAIQSEGDGPREKGLQFTVNDLVDAVACKKFFDLFGVSIRDFLSRCKYRRDAQLRDAARRLLERKGAAEFSSV